MPPQGGAKDETPPVLLSIFPKDSSLQKKISKIELRFNKYMEVKDLEKNLQFSPLLGIPPTVTSFGKRVEIKIVDSLLQDSTTYKLSLGNGLVDNREANPYKDFTYIFSTGSYFDSLTLSGRVFDAKTGMSDTGATIFLYSKDIPDSAVLRQKPMYIQRTDASGNFKFSILPPRPFKVLAVTDENNNHIYDLGEEKIDFLDYPVFPGLDPDTIFQFYLFKEIKDSTTSENRTAIGSEENSRFTQSPKKPKLEFKYKVNVDTAHPNLRSFDINQNLMIDLDSNIVLHESKIFLSYDDKGIEVEAIHTIHRKKNKLELQTKWQEDVLYTLRLVKGWAEDTAGVELLPGKYLFKTKNKDDYGTLKVQIDSAFLGNDYVLTLFQGTDSIFQQAIETAQLTIPLLKAGNYTLRAFKDENKNNKWDPGDYFQKRHAEKVIPYPQEIIIKNGWENEIDFKMNQKKNTEGINKSDRFKKE